MNHKEFTPCIATHPGELIRDELKERGMTQKQMAEAVGIPASVLSETIHGKRAVSKNMALALQRVLDIPAEIWMNMQTQYDLDTATLAQRDSSHETVMVTIPLRDRTLFKEVARRFGWGFVL